MVWGYASFVNNRLSNNLWSVMTCFTSRNIFFAAVFLTAWDLSNASCSGRKILKGQRGQISDGPDIYSANAHCEWLIDAGGPNKTIQLEFKSMSTECSFDFLFVYDGDSHTSPMLASLSGDSHPSPVIATSGYMLLYLFTDRNYMRDGFETNYFVYDCPWNCSGRGHCVNHTCICNKDYTGSGCEHRLCPNLCSNNGVCDKYGEKKCLCNVGYTGQSCSLSTHDNNGTGKWYTLAETGYPARTSHTGFFHDQTECLWMFGGYDLNNVLDDVVRYCMKENKWESLTKSGSWPEGRRGHAMAGFKEGFYIFGGILANDSHSNELWFFNLTTLEWTEKALNSTVKPLPVTGHTLTTVEKWIYLFGGKTEDRVFIDHIYRIALLEGEQWEKVLVRGGNYPPKCLVGHTMVYYKEAKSLVVFGGYKQKNSIISHRINQLHMFHIEDNYWSQIHNQEVNLSSIPGDRAFHSAVILGNYLVVYGGNTHLHNSLEICFNSGFHFYHLGCHMWVNHTHFTGLSTATLPRTGRFGHIAVAAYGDVMLLAGGYSGKVHGDLLAYKVPIAVAHHQTFTGVKNTTFDHCEDYMTSDLCVGDPECVYCRSEIIGLPFKTHCYHRTRKEICLERSHSELVSSCPGICRALHSCGSCASQGRGVDVINSSRLSVYNEKCMWCVKEAQCQKQTDPRGTCESANNTVSGLEGWWEGLSRNLTTIEQCVLEDYPAGLHWIRYRSPKNTTFPDEVTLIRKAEARLKFVYNFEGEVERPFVYSADIVGYLHPLNAVPTPDRQLSLYLGIQQAEGKLYLSRDDSRDNKELVSDVESQNEYTSKKARRRDNSPVFPYVQRGFKYYVEQETEQTIKSSQNLNSNDMFYPSSHTKLAWNREIKATFNQPRDITYEFLEPYSNGSCTGHYNCLSCLTDALCSWCPATDTCLRRDTLTNESACNGPHDPYLITSMAECPCCDYYVSCHTCASNPLCEWVSGDGQCTRRGRVEQTIRNASECHPPCHMRTTCTDCTHGQEKCAWCKNTKKCLPFSDYVTRYLMGECTGWVDNDRKGINCSDCSHYNTCKSCIQNNGHECGWCGSTENPTIGVCLYGDFSGPEVDGNCSALISEEYNVSASEPADWVYDICMDVEECLLGLYECHPNATCINTFDSYECQCNKGFHDVGGGVCEETCFHTCVHGNCSGPMNYQCICHLGWTGMDCNTNCGCNNHSTCQRGVGVCDECQNHTTGPNCNLCRPGSYGNPKSLDGCVPCECNGHGDLTRGTCNNGTGKCYCTDNTIGERCNTCEEGYYGDPWSGGKCYLQCDGRMIKTGITRGAVGTHKGSGLKHKANTYCLWVLSYFDKIDIPHMRSSRKMMTAPTIIISIEGVLHVSCGQDSVYVYDDIPDFVNGPRDAENVSNAVLLGAFCGMNPGNDLVVKAHTGTIVIYFEADLTHPSKTIGFNASYQVIQCPDHCNGNRMCVEDKCVCIPGHGGYMCEIELCPNNCSISVGQGFCHEVYGVCICKPGFGGSACDMNITHVREPHLQILTDPQRILDERNKLPSPRVGHTLTSCGDNMLYLFGGYNSESQLLNDMWVFDINLSKWKSIILPISEEEPSGRYFHAAACIPKRKIIYVFGGFVMDRNRHGLLKTTNELWKFTLESNIWSKEEVPNYVPPLAGHSLTDVGDAMLIVIGGFSTEDYFSDMVFKYKVDEKKDKRWRLYGMELLSGAIPVGLYGHSAVFEPISHTIYVYGGYMYKSGSWYVSRDVHAYDVDDSMWSLLVPEGNGEVTARAFHTAVHLEDKMVVIGGLEADGSRVGHLLIYKYRCNTRHKVDKDLGTGLEAAAVVGIKAVVSNNNIYLFGGFSGTTVGTMSRLTVPDDVCKLIDSKYCNLQGCSLCTSVMEGKENESICYSSDGEKPEGCTSEDKKLKCNNLWYNSTNCYRYTSCSQCLAVYPQFKDQSPKCQWCRNCPEGKCIRKDADCKEETKCNGPQDSIHTAKECFQYLCPYSNCERCTEHESCGWTRNVKRSGESNRFISGDPIYDWNCVATSLLSKKGNHSNSMPPNNCTRRCYTFKTCDMCLASSGGEGGSQECIWSETLQECMPPAYRPLRCSFGECGFVIQQRKNKTLQPAARCPLPCSNHTKCAECITAPGCGWCAFGGQNGLGVCMKGGRAGPSGGACLDDHRMEMHLRKTDKFTETQSDGVAGAHIWSFDSCPPENECLNGHHTCNEKTQSCIDTPSHFKCECKSGYVATQQGEQCGPVCHQRCNQGKCVHPDQCECNFGWVGVSCNTECQCNMHSNCEDETKADNCTQCLNNTQGTDCGECKENFVGNPKKGGKCIPCHQFCNNHTNKCRLDNDPLGKSGRGPTEDEATCVDCQHNTQGVHCQMCMQGHFRLQEEPKTKECTACQCNGHSNMCNRQTGESCLCQNNTESKCDKDSTEPCWQRQCSECREYFMGTPTNNHQCYRQMTVDKEYCFDPETQNNCNREPMALRQGRTVFFAVQPKYLNVNIRITIDVTMGGVDVYFSNKENTFRVIVGKGTGIHSVDMDEEALKTKSDVSESQGFFQDERKANDLNTFITIYRQNTILRVRDVRFRLIITLPRDNHELRTARFYLILKSQGDGNHNVTYGSLYFRQDQPHIDLFVFFSVFFSCFFLFLAMCVMLWKMKQAFDARRTRQLRAREMECMASRPFAKVLLLVEPEHSISMPAMIPKRTRATKITRNIHQIESPLHIPTYRDDHLNINPIAIEPTDDGVAAVGTVLIQLPGGNSVPSKLCLGSALTMRINPPISATKNMRRRPSASSC
ncbi:multiple epidermal growth factor-like domains protein 8 [Haliotis asinina]|uniref:multiple epidermal growth factor-like domains protein 8 n=1 Tax=Haliotis asinina TaxID=109174 RepID=UPI003531A2DD